MIYTKTPKTLDEQIELLKSRGLKITNEVSAKKHLSSISYYRLSAYLLSFQKYEDPNHTYMPWATFERVIELYVFDRELRNILLDAIERIEVALRCRIVYEYSHLHGNNWYENSSLFNRNHSKFIGMVQSEINKNNEVFISHYNQKYTSPVRPPSWMAIEILTFGQISTMLKNLKSDNAKKAVANYFCVAVPILESWVEHLVYVRNTCAHHGRIWNRTMVVTAQIPNNPINGWRSIAPSKLNKVYTTVCITSYLLNVLGHNDLFVGRLRVLLRKFNKIDINAAGFPVDWEKDLFWKNIKPPVTQKARMIIFDLYNLTQKR